MGRTNGRSRKTLLNIELSTFDIPPSGDILVLGKRAAIGPQAGKKMLDTVAPDQFELIQPKDDLIGGILIRKDLFLMADKDSLIKALVEEGKAVMSDDSMIRVRCDIAVTVTREI